MSSMTFFVLFYGMSYNIMFDTLTYNISKWQLYCEALFHLPEYYYIPCHLLDAFIQSDLHTQYCGQSPQGQFGVKCLAQGHNDMLTAVGFEHVTR